MSNIHLPMMLFESNSSYIRAMEDRAYVLEMDDMEEIGMMQGDGDEW